MISCGVGIKYCRSREVYNPFKIAQGLTTLPYWEWYDETNTRIILSLNIHVLVLPLLVLDLTQHLTTSPDTTNKDGSALSATTTTLRQNVPSLWLWSIWIGWLLDVSNGKSLRQERTTSHCNRSDNKCKCPTADCDCDSDSNSDSLNKRAIILADRGEVRLIEERCDEAYQQRRGGTNKQQHTATATATTANWPTIVMIG